MSDRACLDCGLPLSSDERMVSTKDGLVDARDTHDSFSVCIARLRSELTEARHVIETNKEYAKLGTLRRALEERDTLKHELREARERADEEVRRAESFALSSQKEFERVEKAEGALASARQKIQRASESEREASRLLRESRAALAAVTEERERLREALQTISAYQAYDSGIPWPAVVHALQRIASAALAPKEGE